MPRTPPAPQKQVQQALTSAMGLLPTGTKFLACVSGGADSMALLFALHEMGVPMAAASIDHGLRPESADEVELVQAFCQAHGIAFFHQKVSVSLFQGKTKPQEGPAAQTKPPQQGMALRRGLEDAARQARYAALAALAREANATVLVTAHHQDDQAETLLLHALRGTVPHGMRRLGPVPIEEKHRLGPTPIEKNHRAEPVSTEGNNHVGPTPTDGGAQTKESPLQLLRPFLQLPQSVLLAYAAQHNIPSASDPTNANTVYLRNAIRHEVLPGLDRHAPGAVGRLALAADIAADEDACLHQLAQEFTEKNLHVPEAQSPEVLCLQKSALATLPVALQRRVVRLTLAKIGLVCPSFDFTQNVVQLTNVAQGHLSKGGVSVDADSRNLYISGPVPQMEEVALAPGLLCLRARMPGASAAMSEMNTPPHSATAQALGADVPTSNCLGDAQTGGMQFSVRFVHGVPSLPQPRKAAVLAADLGGLHLPFAEYAAIGHACGRSRYLHGAVFRLARPEDVFAPLNTPGEKPLFRRLADRGMPQPLRLRLVVLAAGPRVLWVPGWTIAHAARIQNPQRHQDHWLIQTVDCGHSMD